LKRHLDRIIQSLVMIRLGQELGTDSELARTVASVVDFAITAAKAFLVDH
jgi:hypothetical protein